MNRLTLTVVSVLCSLVVVAPASAVTTSTKTTYYDIVGSTVAEMRADMNLKRTGGTDGNAWGYVSWRFRTVINSSGSKCSITKVSVKHRQTYTMPRWDPPESASDEVRSEWSRYSKVLWAHELGHGAITARAASDIERALRRTSKSSCTKAITAGNAAGNARMKRHTADHAAYDKKTEHGATQGAVFG